MVVWWLWMGSPINSPQKKSPKPHIQRSKGYFSSKIRRMSGSYFIQRCSKDSPAWPTLHHWSPAVASKHPDPLAFGSTITVTKVLVGGVSKKFGVPLKMGLNPKQGTHSKKRGGPPRKRMPSPPFGSPFKTTNCPR